MRGARVHAALAGAFGSGSLNPGVIFASEAAVRLADHDIGAAEPAIGERLARAAELEVIDPHRGTLIITRWRSRHERRA